MRDSDDQELITRFRYLTGKRPLGGFGSPGIDSDFDVEGYRTFDLHKHIHNYGVIGGWSLGDEYCSPTYKYFKRYYAPPPAPMWWDQSDDPNMKLIIDRTKPKGRFYRPAYWPGVFGKKPKKIKKPKKKKEAPPQEVVPRCQQDAPIGGWVGFKCDKCKAVINTYERVFIEARAYAVSIGWRITDDDKGYCRNCGD